MAVPASFRRILFFSLFALTASLIGVAFPLAAYAQATAPVLQLGSVNVGSSATGTVTFTFSGSTTVASIAVVTQGATGLDYARGSGDSCTATTYASTNTCTVNIAFTPKAAGVRFGGVQLLDSSSNILASAIITGTGTGAQLVNVAATSASAFAGFPTGHEPQAVALDAAGFLYAIEASPTVQIDKYTSSGTLASSCTCGLSQYADAIAISGDGYIYVADSSTGVITRINMSLATPTYTTLASLYGSSAFTFSEPYGIAFDVAGNLYVGDHKSIYKITPSGTLSTFLTDSSASLIYRLTFDTAGDLFYTDITTLALRELAYGSSTPVAYGSNGNDFGIAIDPAGNVYTASADGSLFKYPAGSTTPTRIASGLGDADTLFLDAAGNLYFDGTSNNTVYAINRSNYTFTTSSATAEGSTSAENGAGYTNTGNAALAATGVAVVGSAASGPSTNCVTNSPIAIGGSCTFGIVLSAIGTGTTQSGSVTFTGNLLSPVLAISGSVSNPPTQLVFTTAPAASITAGNSSTVVISEENSSGTVVSSTVPVTLTITGPNGYSATYGPTAAVNGVATFSPAALTATGSYTYTATSPNLTTATASQSVVAAAAYSLAITPASTSPYVTATDNMTVKTYDRYGNAATSTDIIQLTSTDSTATLPSNFALAAGTATKSVLFGTVGTFTVTVTDITNGSVASFTTTSISVAAIPSYTVTVKTDPSSGTASNCTNQSLSGHTLDANCSLRDSIAAVNALTLPSGLQAVVNFASGVTGTITLSSAGGALAFGQNTSIVGPVGLTLTISGGNDATLLMMPTADGLTISVANLIFSNGQRALSNGKNSIFSFTNDVFSSNGVGGTANSSGVGGAISQSQGSLNITNCAFSGNLAASADYDDNSRGGFGAYGGAISISGGSASISKSVFYNNSASSTGPADGGAIYATSAITISQSVFVNNSVSSYNAGSTTVENVAGGAFYGPGTITNSLFAGNTAAARGSTTGGAIYGINTLTITGTTVANNKVTTNYGFASSGNHYGGGIYSGSTLSLYNDTIVGNVATNSAGQSDNAERAGGVYGFPTAYNTVISNNYALTSYQNLDGSVSGSNNYIDISSNCGSNCTVSIGPLSDPIATTTGALTVGVTGGPANTSATLQVMLPLPGTSVLGGGTTGHLNSATTDGRGTGYARTITYNGNTLVDIGAAQANYSLAFANQPTDSTLGATISGSPSIQLYESGTAFSASSTTGSTININASAGTLSTSTLNTATNGFESINANISTPQLNDTLIASVTNGGSTTLASVTSSSFNVAGAMNKFVVTGYPTSPIPGTSATVTVTAVDSNGTTFVDFAGTVTLTSTDAAATFSPTSYTYTSADKGVHTFTVTLNTPGTQTITATSGSYTGTESGITLPYASIWVLNNTGTLADFYFSGTAAQSALGTSGNTSTLGAIAIDSNNAVWSVTNANNTLNYVTYAGTNPASYSGGGINLPTSIAVDGNGNLWIANSGKGSISEFANTGLAISTTSGFTSTTATTTASFSGIAIDISGNVWIADQTDNTVLEVVGGAAPVAPPSTGLANGAVGTKP